MRIKKEIRFWWKLNKDNIKEKIFFTGIVTGIFLPIRLLFWNFVSHSWGTNLGIMSLVAIVFFILFRKNKLGAIGKIFQKQIIRLTSNHRVKWVMLFAIYEIFWQCGILYLYDYGELHQTDFNMIYSMLFPYGDVTKDHIANSVFHATPSLDQTQFSRLIQPEFRGIWLMDHISHLSGTLLILGNVVYTINVNYTGYWGTHFITVSLIGEIEGLGLFFFYRSYYRKDLPIGQGWHKLEIFPKNIKQFAKQKVVVAS